MVVNLIIGSVHLVIKYNCLGIEGKDMPDNGREKPNSWSGEEQL